MRANKRATTIRTHRITQNDQWQTRKLLPLPPSLLLVIVVTVILAFIALIVVCLSVAVVVGTALELHYHQPVRQTRQSEGDTTLSTFSPHTHTHGLRPPLRPPFNVYFTPACFHNINNVLFCLCFGCLFLFLFHDSFTSFVSKGDRRLISFQRKSACIKLKLYLFLYVRHIGLTSSR